MKLFFKCLLFFGTSLFSKSNLRFSISKGSSLLLTPAKNAVLICSCFTYLILILVPLILKIVEIFITSSIISYHLPVRSGVISVGIIWSYNFEFRLSINSNSLDSFRLSSPNQSLFDQS